MPRLRCHERCNPRVCMLQSHSDQYNTRRQIVAALRSVRSCSVFSCPSFPWCYKLSCDRWERDSTGQHRNARLLKQRRIPTVLTQPVDRLLLCCVVNALTRRVSTLLVFAVSASLRHYGAAAALMILGQSRRMLSDPSSTPRRLSVR
jgi:hypothetical protein